MKKTAFLATLLIMLTIPMQAQAVTMRASKVFPSLTFDGTKAVCAVTIIGDNAGDDISVTVKLWKGNSCIETWNDSGTGHMNFSATKTVSSSGQYKLTADVTINGTTLPTASCTAYCK